MRQATRTWRRVVSLAAVAAGWASAAPARAAIFAGNGATGFGGPVGTGTLGVTDDGTGDVTFTFTGGPSHPTLDGNDLVVYLSTGAAGLTDTSTLVDNGDGGREAVSGYNAANSGAGGAATRSLVTFPAGFQATYALSIFDGSTTLFQLPLPGTVNYLTFVPTPAQTGPGDTVTFPLADLGLTQGQSFQLVGTDIATSEFRSNETIGTTNPDVSAGGNVGYTDTESFSAADTVQTTAVPEPAAGLAGLAVGGGLACRRRRPARP